VMVISALVISEDPLRPEFWLMLAASVFLNAVW
jgi:hypothetical protein